MAQLLMGSCYACQRATPVRRLSRRLQDSIFAWSKQKTSTRVCTHQAGSWSHRCPRVDDCCAPPPIEMTECCLQLEHPMPLAGTRAKSTNCFNIWEFYCGPATLRCCQWYSAGWSLFESTKADVVCHDRICATACTTQGMGARLTQKRRPLGRPGSKRSISDLNLEACLLKGAGGTAALGGWPRVDTPAERVGPPSIQNARGELGFLFAQENR